MRKQSVLAISVCAALVAAACVSTQVNPAAYSTKTAAVVMARAPVSLFGGDGVVGLSQSLNNSWGQQVNDRLFDRVQRRLAEALRLKLLSPKKVVRAKSYGDVLPGKNGNPSFDHGPQGLRATPGLSDDERVHWAAVGRDLNVDAVVLLDASFTLQDGDTFTPEHGEVSLRVDMLAADGTLLFRHVGIGKAEPKHDVASAGKSILFGAMDEKVVKDAYERAMLSAVDDVISEWRRNR